MKILLVVPPSNPHSIGLEEFFLVEPLALEYIGAGVQDDHEVKLLDLRVKSEPGLKETLEAFEPDIIGTGGFTLDVYNIKNVCSEAKKIRPGILTVVGGHHATMMPQDFFHPDIDIIVTGEGTGAFKKICENVQKQKDLESIGNVYLRKSGQMVLTRKTDFPPLDSLPYPARALTAHIRRKYFYPLMLEDGKLSYMASIRASTGCIFRCSFCSITRMYGQKVYRRSIDNIMGELETIEEPLILWVDDEFMLDSERTLTLAKEIERARIKKLYWIYSRADTIVNHPECIEALAKVGLRIVLIGIESHDDRYLKKIRKATTVSKNEEAFRICHANHVQVRGNFIIHPEFDQEDFKQVIKYARSAGADLPGFSVLTPLPGTELYDEVKDNLITNNYDFFDLIHTVMPTKLSLKEFYKEFTRCIVKGTPFKKKIALYKKIHPQIRKKYASEMKKVLQRLKKAYLDY